MLPKGWGGDGKTDVKEVKWDGHKEGGGGGCFKKWGFQPSAYYEL